MSLAFRTVVVLVGAMAAGLFSGSMALLLGVPLWTAAASPVAGACVGHRLTRVLNG